MHEFGSRLGDLLICDLLLCYLFLVFTIIFRGRFGCVFNMEIIVVNVRKVFECFFVKLWK
jgi:hypothetical protein